MNADTAKSFKNSLLAIVGIGGQILAWTLRTYGHMRCCAVPVNDRFADVRGTSAPGSLILLGVLMSVFLNVSILRVVCEAIRIGKSDYGTIMMSVALGSTFIAIPIASAAYFLRQDVSGLWFCIFIMAPVISGFAETMIDSLRRRQN